MKCPKCGEELKKAMVNGKLCLVCESCINEQNGLLNLEKCDHCNKWYYKRQTKICECRQLTYKV
jgi:uncharacterized protein (UPF0212 family)